ncbi:hypothetical protein KSP40_PGU021413 [Platanthera guangdongensis]|uniref:Uncharacterized protein n=1 Tax=Platanthera guangdongensis TaxID=2320717 RepID=A0ABR2MPT2_9ASPA
MALEAETAAGGASLEVSVEEAKRWEAVVASGGVVVRKQRRREVVAMGAFLREERLIEHKAARQLENEVGYTCIIDCKIKFDKYLVTELVHFVNQDSLGLANDFLSLGFIPDEEDTQLVAEALRASFDIDRRLSNDFQQCGALQGVCSSMMHESTPNSTLYDEGCVAIVEFVYESDMSRALNPTQLPPQLTIQLLADSLVPTSGVMNHLYDVMYEFNFSLPPDYALVIRALGSLEGTAKALDPEFKVIESAYPFVVGRLLTDPDPDMRKILRELLIRNDGSIRWNRLERLTARCYDLVLLSQTARCCGLSFPCRSFSPGLPPPQTLGLYRLWSSDRWSPPLLISSRPPLPFFSLRHSSSPQPSHSSSSQTCRIQCLSNSIPSPQQQFALHQRVSL